MRTPALPATELLPLPTSGRRFTARRRVRLGDVDPAGRLRLDATARYLQDVATDDADDVALGDAFGWVVRRTLIVVERSPRLGEQLELTTFCSGTGRSWAERRTVIRGVDPTNPAGPSDTTDPTPSPGAAGRIDAVVLWVQVDAGSGRPTALDERFAAIYGEAARARRVSSRLMLPSAPPTGAATAPWHLRRVDLDVFDHVNNAAQWAILEEALAGRTDSATTEDPGAPGIGRFELEHLAPVSHRDGPLAVHRDAGADGLTVWLTTGATAETISAKTIGRASTSSLGAVR